MSTLTLIVGLPGSGKTMLAHELARQGGTIIDDISVRSEEKITIAADDLIITDPNACLESPKRVLGKLKEWFGEREVVVMAFENDPERCWDNILRRNDDRVISRATIEFLARSYNPTDWGEVIPVWRPA